MPRTIRGSLGARSAFSLDTSGVAGFFGGDEAVSAMGVVHLYVGRRWLGWYNAPGSYEIGQKYGQLARTRFWDGLFPGPNVEPEVLFELDGQSGPKYRAFHYGTHISETGHIGYLFMKDCEKLDEEEEVDEEKPRHSKVSAEKSFSPMDVVEKQPEAHETGPETEYGVTVAHLHSTPEHATLAEGLDTNAAIFATIPMSVSFACCALCGVFDDWYSFSMILLGIVCSGVSCFIIGSAELRFEHKTPSSYVKYGDGMLMQDEEVIVLLGSQSAVNFVTKGKFTLKFREWAHKADTERAYRSVGFCSLLLMIQFLAQLLLIPQGTLFGQIMFLVSMFVSWGYNLYLSSLDKEIIQRTILLKVLEEPWRKRYTFKSRCAMAAFVMLLYYARAQEHLQQEESVDNEKPYKKLEKRLKKHLRKLIPNNSPVWKEWRSKIARRVARQEDEMSTAASPPTEKSHDSPSWSGLCKHDQSPLESIDESIANARKAFADYDAKWNRHPRGTPGRKHSEGIIKSLIQRTSTFSGRTAVNDQV